MTPKLHHSIAALLLALLCNPTAGPAQTSTVPPSWRERTATQAQILSQVKWSPVADTMPNRSGGFFKKGKEYTGVPYSSVRSEGRYIGFDIGLRTFLSAVENPRSVLYTENLTGKVSNAATYYGSVCSAYTSYALGCGFPEVSRRYGPEICEGIVLVKPQLAEGAQVGDVIYTPHATETSGSHVEMVTAVTRDKEGRVVSVRVEESRPPTTATTDRSAEKFNAHLATRNKHVIAVYLWNSGDSYGRHPIFLTEEQRRSGSMTIPAGLLKKTGTLQVWLIGEHPLGRLKLRKDIPLVP